MNEKARIKRETCLKTYIKNREIHIMELNLCINFLLTVAQHEIFQIFSDELADYGVTPGQYGVLNCLWRNSGKLTPTRIAEMVHLEMPTISGVLDRMEKKGLLERELNQSDRRSVSVIITPKGAALEAPVSELVVRLNEKVFQDFAPEERVSVITALQKMSKIPTNAK